MITSIVVGIIISIIALVVYIEYRNEQKYKEEQRRKKEKKKRKLTPKITKRPAGTTKLKTEEKAEKQTSSPKPTHLQQKNVPQRRSTDKPSPQKPSIQPRTETIPPKEPVQQKPEKTETAKAAIPTAVTDLPTKKVSGQETSAELPKGEYPDFNYERLIEMGLSEEEAMEFIQELIPQIDEQIPLIDEALKIPDFHKMERLTHSIKGSSTTIGTGGVSDLLVEYNTYLKTGDEVPVAAAYQEHLKHYFEKLKKQFPPKS